MAVEKARHQYLILDPAQKEKIILAYVDLAATKAVPRRSGPAAAADQPHQQTPNKTVPPPKK